MQHHVIMPLGADDFLQIISAGPRDTSGIQEKLANGVHAKLLRPYATNVLIKRSAVLELHLRVAIEQGLDTGAVPLIGLFHFLNECAELNSELAGRGPLWKCLRAKRINKAVERLNDNIHNLTIVTNRAIMEGLHRKLLALEATLRTLREDNNDLM